MTGAGVLLLLGIAVAAIVFVVTGGRVVFLPLFLIIPLGFFSLSRRGDGWRRLR